MSHTAECDCAVCDDIRLREQLNTCTWKQETYEDMDRNLWETSCGQSFVFDEGRPSENGAKFCCYCGKRLKEQPYQDNET